MVLPLTDFSGKNSVTCRDQAGQSLGDAVATEQDWTGWRQDRECQEPPDTAPCPQRPPAGSTEHTPASPALCQPIFHTRPARSFGFPRCLEGAGSRRVSHRPLPKSSWGWVTPTQHKGMRLRLGQDEASKETSGRAGGSEPGGMGGTAATTGRGGSLRDVPAVEDGLSPQPPRGSAAQGCGGAAAALPQRRPGRSLCNHGLINALGKFTVCSWRCSS